nr:YhjD/YihY/BrkB family envelope integrity protein [uncultured Holophaga sp.]
MQAKGVETDLGRVCDRCRAGLSTVRIIVVEAFSAFGRNDDLRQASSLAFYTALALIPAMLLLTFVLGWGIGTSPRALKRTTEVIHQVMPDFGSVILREVGAIARNKRGLGIINIALLLWSLTPLVSAFRGVLNHVFKVRPARPVWITKFMDLGISLLVILGTAVLASLSMVVGFLSKLPVPLVSASSMRGFSLYLLVVGLLLLLYRAFAPRMKLAHLLAGALTTATLWFLLKPCFTLFLMHNPGYGLAFGSFKSLFILFIWIYYSMAVLLLGAEVMAALSRKDMLLLKHFLDGKVGPSRFGHHRFLIRVPEGEVFFREGESGREMFYLLRGRVAILRGQEEIAFMEAGDFFGEMGLLLGQRRSATAMALEACECVLVSEQSLDTLMREFPDLVREMLTEMASRLRLMDERLGGTPSGPA